jgi:hypothetical protein
MRPAAECCLGRLPSKHDPRTLRVRDLRLPGIPPPPAERRWDSAVARFALGGNDRYGNCVIVTAANALVNIRANDSGLVEPMTDSAIIDLSRRMGAMDGYNILDRLKYWRRETMWGNRLWAFAQVNPADAEEIKATVNYCGVCDIGVALASAWRGQNVWENGTGRNYTPGSWGLHSVPIVGYDATACYVASWGELVTFPWDALARYSDEAYALIDPDWLGPDGTTPGFLDLPALHAALRELAA